ncbi:MAG TPA: class D sortase [Acidimicrobiales bacterium]
MSRQKYMRMRPRRHVHSRKRVGHWPRRLVAIIGVASIVVGAVIGVQIYRYHVHTDRVGTELIRREQRALAAAGESKACTDPVTAAGAGNLNVPTDGLAATSAPVATGSQPNVDALLQVPAVGLVAPVVDGTGEAELSVAVGHVKASSWPGPTGTTVLEAHDVTWFNHLDQLKFGDAMIVKTPCHTFTYTVGSSHVVAAGTPVLQTVASQLLLVTCYPLDALSLTTQRLVVTAGLTSIVDHGAKPGSVAAPTAPVVPAPAALADQGLDLAHNPAPMGTLSISGTPTAAWQQSSAPLDDENAVVALYFAALRSAEQHQPLWWSAVAPSVPLDVTKALVGATVAHNDSTFDPVLDVTGVTFTGASLTTMPELVGGPDPGRYRITMTATDTGGVLEVTGWIMARG